MEPSQILETPSQILSDSQRETFFEQGYLHLEGFLSAADLAQLSDGYAALIQRFASRTSSDDDVLIEPDHTAAAPRFKRFNRVTDQHAAFWRYASDSDLTEVVSDLLGPSVRFRESYVNCKSSFGGDAIDWHQDFPFFPHTNRALLTVLTYLVDVSADMGPIQVVPATHRGELYDHYNPDGSWAGALRAVDQQALKLDEAVTLCGPAGTLVIFDCCTVHGSAPNHSANPRPLVVTGYGAADAFCYTNLPANMSASQAFSLVRGEPPIYAHHEPVRVKVPPDWGREHYVNIFDAQK